MIMYAYIYQALNIHYYSPITPSPPTPKKLLLLFCLFTDEEAGSEVGWVASGRIISKELSQESDMSLLNI